MGSYAALSHTTWIDGYDWTADLNRLAVQFDWQALDNTAFSMTAHRRIGGLESAQSALGGWHDLAVSGQDVTAFTGLGATTKVVTHSVDGTETSVAYAYLARKLNYKIFGQLGEVAPFELGIMGSRAAGAVMYPAVRGQIAKAKGVVSATGQLGSVLNLGAPTSSQYVYATVHIFAAGTTITIQVQSDDNSGMTTPTTRATIGPLTATGGTWMTRVAGPFAGEAYWRLNVSAITGSFTIGATIAVDRNP